MIDVFYSPGKGIYLSDVFCQESLLREFDQTGQVLQLYLKVSTARSKPRIRQKLPIRGTPVTTWRI